MGESFAPVLSSGTATFNVPIAVPPGRHGVQPSLALAYGSSNGNGPLGIGWSMGVPFIARQTDRGTPRYQDQARWHVGEDRFIYNGGQELVPVDNQAMAAIDASGHYVGADVIPSDVEGWQQYRAKVDGAFLRFFRSPDAKRWVVQSLDGTRFDFGLLPSSEGGPSDLTRANAVVSESANGAGRIYSWQLTRMSDAHGSTVYYQYVRDQGAHYLDSIFYISPASCAPAGATATIVRRCAQSLANYGARIKFEYAVRPDVFTSYVSGWGITQGMRMVRITATAAEESVGTRYLVRRYWLAYDSSHFHSLLASLQVEGRAETALSVDSGINVFMRTSETQLSSGYVGVRLPAMTFDYSTQPTGGTPIPGFGGLDPTVRTVLGAPPVSLDENQVDLFDVNGDGLVDVLVTDGARYRGPDGTAAAGVYWNGFTGSDATPAGRAGSFSQAVVLPLDNGAETLLRLTNPNLLGMDVDGDGRGDFANLPPNLGHGWITPARLHPDSAISPANQGWAFVHTPRPLAVGQTPEIDLARDGTFYRVMDVNNDHLTDIVRSTGTSLQTWYNLGWVEGGEGRFGRAELQNGVWVPVGQPVTSCLPHDGLPLDFGNGEIRLADMNGDGLTDIVRMRDGAINYWPGRGNEVWGEGSSSCASGFASGREIRMTGAPATLNGELAGVYVQDIDGDGASDVIQVRYNNVDVWFNRAGRSFTERITISAPFAPDFAPNLRLVDIDGTGTTDLVYGRANDWRYLDLLGGQRPRLLTRVHNGLGATTAMTYGSSAEDYMRDLAAAANCSGEGCENFLWDGVRRDGCDSVIDAYAGRCVYRSGGSPVISSVVRQVQTTDNFDLVTGRANVQTTQFAYHDGYYEGIEQEFRGFGAADAHVLGDATVPGQWTRTWFHQGRRPNALATTRLAENPDEALKGSTYLSEVFDEGGQYLASMHTSMAVRHLMTGLDGRRIAFAHAYQTDSFTYDTMPFTANSATLTLDEVRREDATASGFPDNASVTQARTVKIRGQRFVWTRSTVDETDNLGQQRQTTAHGRLHDEDDGPSPSPSGIGYGEAIVQTALASFVGSPDGWLLKPSESYTSDASGSPRYGHTITTYNAVGDPTYVAQPVAAVGGISFPGLTYANQTIQASSRYDAFGNATASCGGADISATAGASACRRYAEVDYDTAYSQLAIAERHATGSGTSGFQLLASSGTWERGLGKLLSATDPNAQTTTVGYDGLGRTVYAQPPANPSCPSPMPPAVMRYVLREGGSPVSYVETTADARNADDGCATSLVTVTRAYADGLGRSRGSVLFASDEHTDGGLVSGVTELNARGQATVAYDPRWILGTSASSASTFIRPSTSVLHTVATYDAFGRVVRARAQDGTYGFTVLHASSQLAFDPNDDGQQNSTAPHHVGTYTMQRADGHGRAIDQIQILRQPGEPIGVQRYLRLFSEYRADGKVTRVIRAETSDSLRRGQTAFVPGHSIERVFTYDQAGRRITSTDPDSDDPSAGGASTGRWRYLFDDLGQLVATRDPRGCGQDFYYDLAGRLRGEAYVGCGEADDASDEHLDASVSDVFGPAGLVSGPTLDVLYHYDSMPSWAPSPPSAAFTLGRATGVSDRGQRSAVAYDARGNAVWTARQMAVIPEESSGLSVTVTDPTTGFEAGTATSTATHVVYDQGSDHTYVSTTRYDQANRPVERGLPSDPDWALFRDANDSSAAPAVSGRMRFNSRGLPRASTVVLGSLERTVLQAATYDAYGAPAWMRLRASNDADGLVQTFLYSDAKHRPTNVRVERGASSGVGGAAGTLNAVLVPFDDSYGWDNANNLVSITSQVGPSPMPAGRRSLRRTVAHDSLYRVAQVSMEYMQDDLQWGPYDQALDWRAERTRTNADSETHRAADPMRSTPSPRVGPLPEHRIVDLQYEYDWLANQTRWEDDAASFYERSLGEVGNGADALLSAPQGSANALRPSALYVASNLRTAASQPNADGQGWLDVDYGVSGNVLEMTVRASCTDVTTNSCVDDPSLAPAARERQLRAGCACAEQQHFQYRWDELGRMVEARRYDYRPGSSDWTLSARQRSRYDSGNVRTVKQSLSPDASAGTAGERLHLYVYPGDFERAGVRVDRTANGGPSYVGDADLGTETQYQIAGTNVVWKPGTAATGFERKHRITMPLRDMLGTASAVVDLESGHLLEMATFTPNGAREMHWMTDEASLAPERNAFTGKEEDEEVGVTYFGHRYLIARIGRWANPDPLAAHAMGGGEAGNAYHYVAGNHLQATDPSGLDGVDARLQGAIPLAHGTEGGDSIRARTALTAIVRQSEAYGIRPTALIEGTRHVREFYVDSAGLGSHTAAFFDTETRDVWMAPEYANQLSSLFAGVRDSSTFDSAVTIMHETVHAYLQSLVEHPRNSTNSTLNIVRSIADRVGNGPHGTGWSRAEEAVADYIAHSMINRLMAGARIEDAQARFSLGEISGDEYRREIDSIASDYAATHERIARFAHGHGDDVADSTGVVLNARERGAIDAKFVSGSSTGNLSTDFGAMLSDVNRRGHSVDPPSAGDSPREGR